MPLILITIGIILIIYNYNAIKENKTSFKFILNEEKENLNDYKLELGILRRDIGESLTEIQEEIRNIKINLHMTNDIEKMYENESDILNSSDDISENIFSQDSLEENQDIITSIKEQHEGVVSDINFEEKIDKESSKTDRINELIEQELTDDEICKDLSISKGEVLLVRNLFKS